MRDSQKGEIGAFYDSVDTTYQGHFPVNPDGGRFSRPAGGRGWRVQIGDRGRPSGHGQGWGALGRQA